MFMGFRDGRLQISLRIGAPKVCLSVWEKYSGHNPGHMKLRKLLGGLGSVLAQTVT